jgi:hypothetical protein
MSGGNSVKKRKTNESDYHSAKNKYKRHDGDFSNQMSPGVTAEGLSAHEVP